MSGFMGIGGSAAKTDRKQMLGGYGDLQNVFSQGMGASQSGMTAGRATTSQGLNTMGQGLDTLGRADQFNRQILSGDRAAGQAAIAPEANAARDAADAQKRGDATFGTARGGGVAAANQQSQDQLRAHVDNLLFGARAGAAQAEAGIGQAQAGIGQGEAGIGQSQYAQALQALGISAGDATNLTSIASGSRNTSNAITQQGIGQVRDFVGDIAMNI